MTFLKRNQSAESGKEEKKGKRKKSIDGGKIFFFKIFNSLWRALQLCSSSIEQVRVGRMRMVRRRCGRRSRGSKSLSSSAALRQRNISALQKGQSWLSAWLSLNSRWNWITNWQKYQIWGFAMQNDAFKGFVIERVAIDSCDQSVTWLEHLRGCWYSKLRSPKQLIPWIPISQIFVP